MFQPKLTTMGGQHSAMAGTIKLIFLCCSLALASSFLYSQEELLVNLHDKPQSKENYEKLGHYDIAVVLDKTHLYKGDEFKADVYFTGYGAIGLSKITIYPSSPNILDSNSKIITSLEKDSTGVFWWGGGALNFNRITWVIGLNGGIEYKKADSTSYFSNYIDMTDNALDITIAPEISIRRAPLTLNMKVKNHPIPGDYKISFYYTYYNGEHWAGSSATAEFRINSFVEEYSNPITIISVSVALLGLIPLSLEWLKYIRKLLAKKYMTQPIVKHPNPTGPPSKTKRK